MIFQKYVKGEEQKYLEDVMTKYENEKVGQFSTIKRVSFQLTNTLTGEGCELAIDKQFCNICLDSFP